MCRSDLCLLRRLAVTVLLTVLGGCASTGGGSGAGTQGVDPVRAGAPPEMTLDGEHGFTVTEVVRIGSDVRRDYQQAVVLLRAGQLDDGIELLESVVERAPEVTIPYIDLGVAYARQDQLDKAEARLKSALSLAPNHPAALNELGIVYRRAGRFDAARESYERALAVHPGFHFALRNLGVLCDLYLDDPDCALDSYERYADIVTDDEQVGIWIADIRNRMGIDEE